MLVTEMAVFMLLILPLPFTWRRRLFTFISENPVIAKVQYGMKVHDVDSGAKTSEADDFKQTDSLHRRIDSFH